MGALRPGPDEGALAHDTPAAKRIRFKRCFKALAHVLYGLTAIVLIATAGFWWWAGTDSSLAQAVRLGQTCCGQSLQALTIEQASGSLRSGGTIERAVWQQDGLTVEARGISLAWQPWALLDGTLQLDRLAFDSVQINDQRPPALTPAAGPPETLRLPLRVALDRFSIGTLGWSGPAEKAVLSARDVAGRYDFDGSRHALQMTHAQVASGQYSGSATLTADSPLTLRADLKGALRVVTPAAINNAGQQAAPSAPLALTFEATAAGALRTLEVNADLQLATGTDQLRQPRAKLAATVTPWAAQPLSSLDADFKDLDIAAFLASAPHTLLTGRASVQPIQGTASGALTAQVGDVQAQLQLTNALAGPLDQQRLPLEKLDATGQLQQGRGMLQTLKALGAGGQLVASGQWAKTGAAATDAASASASPKVPATAPAQGWKLQATLENINPAKLHSQLAALPLDGQATVQSQGEAIGFDASVAMAKTRTPARTPARTPSSGTAVTAPSDDLSRQLRQLRLQSARATGNWRSTADGATLVLSVLRVRSDDAGLGGQLQAQFDPRNTVRSAQGKLQFMAPGVDARIDGQISQTSGAGEVSINGKDAAKALRWLQKMPGMPVHLQSATATGSASLTSRWQGGWQDPNLQARLAVPSLDWRMTSGDAATTLSASTHLSSSAPALKLRGVQATLTGRLSQAQISAEGRLESGEQRFALQLAMDAGRKNASSSSAPSWQGVLRQLRLSAQAPALGNGAWQLATSSPVTVKWTPATAPPNKAASTAGKAKGGIESKIQSGLFETGAGQAVLTSPTLSISPTAVTTPSSASALAQTAPAAALLTWQPVRWQPGAFTTAGKLTGLPMAWLTALAGPQMASMGLSGNLVFDADWDARLTDTLSLKASLVRSSGDITLQAEAAQVGAARIAAGVQQARLSLESIGDAVTLAVRWNSERAGSAEGQLKTSFKRATGADQSAGGMALGGWLWPLNAPLAGQLRAQLPRVGVWSALAPPGWRVRGSLGANISIAGTRAAPQLTGDLQANDLALRSVVDGIEFGGGRLRAQLDGTRMLIQEFTLQGAGPKGTGGMLTATGQAHWLDGQPSVALNARLDRLRASIRTDRQITLSGDLKGSLEGQLSQFDGTLRVDQARIVLPEESTPTLGDDVVVRGPAGSTRAALPEVKASRLHIVAPAKQNRPLLRLNVALDMGQDFRVQGKGIDTLVRGTLNLSGESLTEPRLAGTLNTFGGQYKAYGQRLDVERGLLRFTGAVDNPTLDILAIRPNPIQTGQRVGVQILGTALLPRVRLYAQPELPDAEKLSWLVLGQPLGADGGQAALLQQAALALFGNKAGAMSGGLAASLGLDDLSFRGASSNADGTTNQGAVTLGKRFSRNFYASYERTVSGALGTLYIFYDLSKRLTIRAQAGQQSAVDLIFTVPYD